MRRFFYLTSIVALLAATLAGRPGTLSGTPAPAAGAPLAGAAMAGADVKIDNFTFTPASLTVPAGTQVTWTNHDDIPHNVVSDDNAVKSKVLDTDEKFSFTFTKPGTYSYFCSLHPKMKGTIVVQ